MSATYFSKLSDAGLGAAGVGIAGGFVFVTGFVLAAAGITLVFVVLRWNAADRRGSLFSEPAWRRAMRIGAYVAAGVAVLLVLLWAALPRDPDPRRFPPPEPSPALTH